MTDPSPRYFTMCRAAAELQALHDPAAAGQVVAGTWLPTQRELQALVPAAADPVWGSVRLGELAFAAAPQLDSYEQLWLAIVMRDRFAQVWDGAAWTAKPA